MSEVGHVARQKEMQMRNPIMMTVLAFVTSLGCAEQERIKECSEADCVDGIDIELVRDDWSSGSYVVEIDMGGTQVVCTASVPSDVSEQCDHEDVELFTQINGELLDVVIRTWMPANLLRQAGTGRRRRRFGCRVLRRRGRAGGCWARRSIQAGGC